LNINSDDVGLNAQIPSQ